jgi:hypothetical protein
MLLESRPRRGSRVVGHDAAACVRSSRNASMSATVDPGDISGRCGHDGSPFGDGAEIGQGSIYFFRKSRRAGFTTSG